MFEPFPVNYVWNLYGLILALLYGRQPREWMWAAVEAAPKGGGARRPRRRTGNPFFDSFFLKRRSVRREAERRSFEKGRRLGKRRSAKISPPRRLFIRWPRMRAATIRRRMDAYRNALPLCPTGGSRRQSPPAPLSMFDF